MNLPLKIDRYNIKKLLWEDRVTVVDLEQYY